MSTALAAPKPDELLTVLGTATTPAKLLKLLKLHRNSLSDIFDHVDERYLRRSSQWGIGKKWVTVNFSVLTSPAGKHYPKLALHQAKGPVFVFFNVDAPPPYFNFPTSNQKHKWVCAAFDADTTQFLNALFIGSFQEAMIEFADPSLTTLQANYAQYVASLDVRLLGTLRTTLQNAMLDEIEAANEQHALQVAAIRNRHRNQLNYFTSLFDDAQAAHDAVDSAQYVYTLDGFPTSKAYHSYKEVRRAHSRRNIPNTDCTITRHTAITQELFARWSVEDRVWVIL